MRIHEHVFGQVFNQPLMILPGRLSAIVAALDALWQSSMSVDAMPQSVAIEPVEAASGAPVPTEVGPHAIDYGNGVGQLTISGSLVHRASSPQPQSGSLQNYQASARGFETLMASDNIKHILLDLNSPGGSVQGVFDFAEKIAAARGVKPVTALVNEYATSAAYLLASAASEVVAARTSMTGSIGVIAAHVDRSALNERQGVKVTPVYAGAKKNDLSPDMPLTDEARASLQADVDAVYGLFVDAVARNRGLSSKVVRAQQAEVFRGAAGVENGLVDRVAPIDATVRKIFARFSRTGVSASSARGAKITRQATARRIAMQANS